MGALGLALKGATLLGGGAIIGDTVQGLSQWGGKRKTELNKMGDADFEDYQPSLFDQYILGTGSKEEAGTRRDTYTTEDAKTGSGKAQYLQYSELVPDLKVEAGDDITDIIARNSGAIKAARKKEKIDDIKLADTTSWNSQSNQHRLLTEATARNDRLLSESRIRADNNQSRLDEIEYRRMRDSKEDRRYNESIERMNTNDRRAAMSSLGAGLAALGAAFAL